MSEVFIGHSSSTLHIQSKTSVCDRRQAVQWLPAASA